MPLHDRNPYQDDVIALANLLPRLACWPTVVRDEMLEALSDHAGRYAESDAPAAELAADFLCSALRTFQAAGRGPIVVPTGR